MGVIFKIAMWLLVIAGLIMGYEGLTDQDLVEVMFGLNTTAELVVDSIFGIAGILGAFHLITRK